MACNKCYNPAECRHISNCSSSPLWDAECDTDTEHQLNLLDRYYTDSIKDQFCKGVTCCKIVPCCTLEDNWPPPPEIEIETTYLPMSNTTTSHGETDYMLWFRIVFPSVFVFVCVFIIACIFYRRNKHILNTVSNIVGQTEEDYVATSEGERSNGDTYV